MNPQRKLDIAILHEEEERRQCPVGSRERNHVEVAKRESTWEGDHRGRLWRGRVSQSCVVGRDGVMASR